LYPKLVVWEPDELAGDSDELGDSASLAPDANPAWEVEDRKRARLVNASHAGTSTRRSDVAIVENSTSG
jgi:hypothetical protein|tara:strand:+ start:5240 stop:5446 length:207 start_codon:yes stop_codon:yes gene_type:complete